MGKIVFASDFHLGQKGLTTSGERERSVIRWMEDIAGDADEVFLLGDIFDFWYEYRSVIPKGFTRFLGALSRLADTGKPVHLFTGNHDMWIFDYFTKEFGIPVYRKPEVFERHGKKLVIGHGDGLGPGDYTYKFIKKIFNNPLCIHLFHWLHPSIGMAIANRWSTSSREGHDDIYTFLGPEKEFLLQYCEAESALDDSIDYFVFGHRHLPIDYLLKNKKTRYINTGDWLAFQSYATMEDGQMTVGFYDRPSFTVVDNEPASWKNKLSGLH